MSKSSSVIPRAEVKQDIQSKKTEQIPQIINNESKNNNSQNEVENSVQIRKLANLSLAQLRNHTRSPVKDPIIIDSKVINNVCIMGTAQNIQPFNNLVKFDLVDQNISFPIQYWVSNSVLRYLKIQKDKWYKIHGKLTIENESAHITCFTIEAITDMNEYSYHCLEITYEHICNTDHFANMTYNIHSFISAPQFKATQGCTLDEIYSNFTNANNNNKTKQKIDQALQTLIDQKYILYNQKYYKPINKTPQKE